VAGAGESPPRRKSEGVPVVAAPPQEEHVPVGADDNPIRREIERRRREAATQDKPQAVQAIRSVQKSSKLGIILIITGIALAVIVAALLTLHFTHLVKLF
jgi:hypothetical protein